MPKRQKALETATESVSPPEPNKKKKAADKSPSAAKTPAATHKRAAGTTKKESVDQLASAGGRTIEQAALAAGSELSRSTGGQTATMPTHEQIALRAYFHFVSRGGQHGCDVDDWCRAERELLELA